MYNKYFDIREIKENDYKNFHTFGNNKYYFVELFTNKEIDNLDVKPSSHIIHDVMSYGENNYVGKFITNFNSIRYLALNQNENKIYKTCEKRDKSGNLLEIYQYTQPLCLVENKTQFYVLNFDFDYKYEKYPNIFAGYTDLHDVITLYIIENIIKAIDFTLEVKKKQLEYIWAEKTNSYGHHIYWNNIIVNKQLHQFIFNKTLEFIEKDKKYPSELIKQIFDACVGKANGLRMFYFKINDDYYFPSREKSTAKFDSDPNKHFHLCILNTNYSNYTFDLKISQSLIDDSICMFDVKMKTKDTKKNILKQDDEYLTDFVSLDLDGKNDLFVGLTNIINISRIDDYSNWISLIFLHKNYNLKDNIIKLSKKSKKFDEKSLKIIENIWSGKQTNKNPITLGSLIKWAKEDNLAQTNILFAKYFLTLKLDVKSIDEILLSRIDIKPDIIETSQYISKNAVDKIISIIDTNSANTIVVKSKAGTGKTTLCENVVNYYVKKYPSNTIISIITRRSMSACHLSAFNTSKNDVKFTSYLDKSIDSVNYFISSLEHLCVVEDTYDMIILDEVNSLINYFYSSTLANKRLQCISTLLKLISKAKLVIALDANITDMVLALFTQLDKKIFFYANTYQNKKDVKLNIHYCVKYNEDNNLMTWCEKYIMPEYIAKSKSCLVLSDSKEITDKLKLLFIKSNSNEDYYRIFTRDEGKLEDMENINIVGKNRLIIASPKIVYGIDIQIEYDEIFLIYRRTSGLQSMQALEMFQQMNRARKTKAVNILVLDPNARYAYNKYIDYETNKKMQDMWINSYVKFHDELCKKYNVINEMGCTIIDPSGKIKFTTDSFMTQIHYLKTWYDQLFYGNKIDIIKLISTEYGYNINECIFESEYKFNSSLKSKLKLKKEEIIELSKQIYLGLQIYPQYKYYVENLREQITQREKYLKNINDNELYIELACDQDKFTNWINKKYMDLSKEEFNKKQIGINNKEISQIVKENELLNKINACFWFEDLLKFPRYKIEDIKCNDIESIKKVFE